MMSTPTDDAFQAAVIIPHFNDLHRLELCLEALSQNALEGVEVVVADNGSDPDPAPLLERFGFARLVREPSRGAAAARNCGVAVTTAPILLFLDADCVPAPDWVATGRALAAPETIIGGHIDVFSETEGPLSGAEAFEAVFAFHQKDYIVQKRFSVTANLVTTRTLFEATGPFIVGVSEDMDWCHRALATGASITYAETLRIGHPARQDWPALRKKWRRLTEEAFGLTGGGLGARLRWFVRALAMPASALAHSSKVLTSPALAPKERLPAVATLFRLRLSRAAWMMKQAMTGQP